MQTNRIIAWLRRLIWPDLLVAPALLGIFVGFVYSMPYERDKHLDLFPTEKRIGIVAMEQARYIKAKIERDDVTIISFRDHSEYGNGLFNNTYQTCWPVAKTSSDEAGENASAEEAEGSSAEREDGEGERTECVEYSAAESDLRCSADAAATMTHVPEDIDSQALLLSIMGVESFGRSDFSRKVEFLLFDAAGLIGWEPDLSLGRGQIRASTAARILSQVSGADVDVDYTTARDYLQDDCKTFSLMAEYLDELFSESVDGSTTRQAFVHAIARYNGQQGPSFYGRMYISVVTGAYSTIAESWAISADSTFEAHLGTAGYPAVVSFETGRATLGLGQIVRLRNIVQAYRNTPNQLIIVQARSDGVGSSSYQQILIQGRTNEIKRWLLRVGAVESDIVDVPVEPGDFLGTGDSSAAVFSDDRERWKQ